ncbi:hypothetical protein DRQ53_11015 [bacterium]|nr:MAG: hypothetical protein DRQ53_11015 [bacterium]
MMRVVLSLCVAVLVALPAIALAVVGDVNQPDVCYLCHESVQDQQEAPHVHTAFAEGNCSNCHNPHASKHAALLAGEERDICLSCHAPIAEALTRSTSHSPVERGECTACHDPHASQNSGQLHLPLIEQCTECHAVIADWLKRPMVHEPVASGDCETCHDPHGSEFAALLPGQIVETCRSCHEADAAMNAAHGSPALAESDCTACHDPHSSDGPGLLRSIEHGPFASGNCTTCHGDMDGRTDFRVADIRTLCERCHMSTRQFADFPLHHNLDHPRSCVQCHNPHASNVEALLLKRSTDLCAGCHFAEPEREKPRAAYATHDVMDCGECHVPHGGVNENYLRTLSTDLCSDCHTEAHQVSHPVGPDVIDPRTEMAVNCLSCHQLHGADFAKYLPLDPTRDLCLQCHRR